jgi:hypothetical protein
VPSSWLAAQGPAANAAAAEYLIVSGSARADGSAGQLDTPYRLTSDAPGDSFAPTGNHCLRLTDANGQPTDYCFDLTFQDEDTLEPLAEEFFSFVVPCPPGAQRVALLRGDRELAALSASPHAPAVNITTPRAGETWTGAQTIRWSATDADGDALSYLVLYSPDDGQAWYPLDLEFEAGTEYALDTAEIAGGDRIRFRVLASDGLNTAQAEVGPITVPSSKSAASVPGTLTAGALAPLALCGGGALLAVLALVGILAVVVWARRRPAAPAPAPYPGPSSTQPYLGPSPMPSYPGPMPTPGAPLTGGTQAYYTPAAGVPLAPVARLAVAQGRANYPYLDVSVGGVIIGRDASCGLVVYDPQVSGQHARLDWAGNAWVIRDLNSRNGTYVNGVRTASQTLRPGDQILVGQTVLVFQG